MKYLKKFDTHAEYEAAKEALPTHNTSICADEQITGDTYSVVHYDEIINRSIMLKKTTDEEEYVIGLVNNPDLTDVDFFIVDGEKVEKSTTITLVGAKVHTVYIVLKEGVTELPKKILYVAEEFDKITIPPCINKITQNSMNVVSADTFDFKGIITGTSMNAFWNNDLHDDFDFEHLIEIGLNSFAKCTISTPNVSFPIVKTLMGAPFSELRGMETVTVGKFLETTIGSTFMKCLDLKSVVMESINLETIKTNDFAECPNLETVNIKSRNLKKIEIAAFINSPNLKTVTLRSEILESIGENAFNGCSGLTTISIYALVPPTIPSNLFDDADLETLKIRVKRGLADAYKEAWPQYADNIVGLLR